MIPLDAICKILQMAGEPLHFSDIAQRLINRNDWNTRSSDPAKLLDQYICEYIRETPKDRRRIRRTDPGVYGLPSHSAAVKFEPDLRPLPEAHIRNRTAHAFMQKQASRGSLTPRKRKSKNAQVSRKHSEIQKQTSSKPQTPQKLPKRPYADAACQVLIRWSKRKPMHFRMIAKKAVELSLVRGPVEDAADKMLAQLLEERSRRNCRFSFHGEGLIGLMRWGSG